MEKTTGRGRGTSHVVFMLKRCTTGAELGGKEPNSVTTILMNSAGVTSYMMFRGWRRLSWLDAAALVLLLLLLLLPPS